MLNSRKQKFISFEDLDILDQSYVLVEEDQNDDIINISKLSWYESLSKPGKYRPTQKIEAEQSLHIYLKQKGFISRFKKVLYNAYLWLFVRKL